ncbi:MAG: hypothetical protein HZA88_12905 [Verrucomicrobia bacterium]|nr:hypothetical protein [Verrucomicrobiota bacterium]
MWSVAGVLAIILGMLLLVEAEIRWFSKEYQDIVTIIRPTAIVLSHDIPNGRSTSIGYSVRFSSGAEREIFLVDPSLKAGDKVRISYMETTLTKSILIGEYEVVSNKH